MQNIYGIIFIFTSIVLTVRGNTLPASTSKSLYDALVEYSNSKCPYLKTTKLLHPKPAFLDRCSNYDAIKSIKSFSFQTSMDVLCLLYYNNYVSLCNVLGKAVSFNDTVIDSILKSFTKQNTCKYLQHTKLIGDLEDMKDIVGQVWDKCDFVCTDREEISPVCGFAATSLNLTEWFQKYVATMEAMKNQQVKGSAPAKAVLPKSEAISPAVASKPDVKNGMFVLLFDFN